MRARSTVYATRNKKTANGQKLFVVENITVAQFSFSFTFSVVMKIIGILIIF